MEGGRGRWGREVGRLEWRSVGLRGRRGVKVVKVEACGELNPVEDGRGVAGCLDPDLGVEHCSMKRGRGQLHVWGRNYGMDLKLEPGSVWKASDVTGGQTCCTAQQTLLVQLLRREVIIYDSICNYIFP